MRTCTPRTTSNRWLAPHEPRGGAPLWWWRAWRCQPSSPLLARPTESPAAHTALLTRTAALAETSASGATQCRSRRECGNRGSTCHPRGMPCRLRDVAHALGDCDDRALRRRPSCSVTAAAAGTTTWPWWHVLSRHDENQKHKQKQQTMKSVKV